MTASGNKITRNDNGSNTNVHVCVCEIKKSFLIEYFTFRRASKYATKTVQRIERYLQVNSRRTLMARDSASNEIMQVSSIEVALATSSKW